MVPELCIRHLPGGLGWLGSSIAVALAMSPILG